MMQAVQVKELPAFRVASVLAFGPQPESEAWEKLRAWAGPRGLLDAPGRRIFGFDNPGPSPESPNYGYEFWLTVDADCAASEGVEIKEYAGGSYAVMACDPEDDPHTTIPEAWRRLVAWREASAFASGHHQWLEEHHVGPGGSMTLTLHLPLARDVAAIG
jgi:DNA gyrase inhibitor GyrI